MSSLTAVLESRPGRQRQTRRARGTGKFIVGGIIVTVFVLAALAPGLIAPFDPMQQDLTNALAPPGGGHLLGTDSLGRDVFSRIVYAARVDLRVGVLGAVLPMMVGVIVGLIAGLSHSRISTALMRLADIVIAFPVLILFMVLVGLMNRGEGLWFLGPGEAPVLLGFALVGWPMYARLLNSEIKRVKTMGYFEAARAGGVSTPRLIARHVVPNSIGQVLVYNCVDIALAILALSALSFIGLGVPPGVPEWGAMIADGSQVMATSWWLVVAPGVVIAVLGVALALIGDGVDDRLKGN
jgi:peptide/nickel transport system permease protein